MGQKDVEPQAPVSWGDVVIQPLLSWSPEEERILTLEVEIKAGTPVPSRKRCTEIIKQYEGRGLFTNRTNVVMQNKYRRMIIL